MSVQVKGSGTIGGLDEGLVVSGIVTASTQINVGSNIKVGSAGVVTATSFVGSGANLTGITQTTINNNANNRIITGSGTANTLEGKANLTFDGNLLKLQCDSGEFRVEAANGVDAFSVDSDNGNTVIGSVGTLTIPDSIIHSGDTNTKIRFPAADTISMEVAGSEVFKIVPDAAHGSSQSIRLRTTHTIDGAAVNMGGTKAYSAGIIRGLVNIRDGNAYNVTDNGGGLGFSAIYNSSGSHTTMSQIEGVKANNTDTNYEGAIKFSTRHNLGNMVEKARIGLNGLSFQGDTAAANCLDDYEEGSYTANFEVTSGSANFHNNTLHYVKIGSMCYVHGEIGTNSASSAGGDLRFDLPFTAKASGSNMDGHARGLVGAIWNYYGTSNPYGNYGWYPLHIQLNSGNANNIILYIVGYNSQNSNWGPIGNLIGSGAQIGISFTYRTN